MATTAIVPASNRGVLKKVGWSIMVLLALLMFLMALRYLIFNPEEGLFPVQRAVYIAHRMAILTHIAGAMVATIIGPFQF